MQCRPCISAMAMSGSALPGERGDEGGVDCDLALPPQRQTICDDRYGGHRGFGHWVCSSLLPGCWWSPWPRPHDKCELLLVQVARRDCARTPAVHKLIDGRQGGQGERQTESPKHKQTKVFGRKGGLGGVWDAGECSARIWSGLGV